jgi:hypothetical protein
MAANRTGSYDHDYLLRRLAEEQVRAERAPDPRARAAHQRAARIFRELIHGKDWGLDG